MEEKFMFLLKYATFQQVKEFISQNSPMNLHCPKPSLETPLTATIHRGDIRILSYLIERNPSDLDETLSYPCGRTVLMYASFIADAPDILHLLLKKGANPLKKDIRGWSCLQHAIIGERLKNVVCLLNYGVPVDQRDFEERTPLMISVFLSNLDTLSLLLTHGADINARDKQGLTALQLAIIWRKRDASILLIENGSDMTVVTASKKTTLSELCKTSMPKLLPCMEHLPRAIAVKVPRHK